MNERLVFNLQKMVDCWSSRVAQAKQELEQAEPSYVRNHFQRRATFRQYGLSLACVHEELERLTGTENWRRAQAFEQYTDAMRSLQQLRAEAGNEGTPDLESAERKADSALWAWCAASY